MEGCLGSLWIQAQQVQFHRLQRTRNRSGTTWGRMVATRMVEFAFALWEQRNEAAHGKTTSVAERDADAQIDAEFAEGFRGLYGMGLTSKTPRHLKKSKLSTKKALLRRIRVLRQALARCRLNCRAPQWAKQTIGYIEWVRRCKPAKPTADIVATFSCKYPRLLLMEVGDE